MKDGLLMQAGRPQEVYDEPRNLFVAKFLGTPPINVFDGSIRNGQLYIGTEAVLPVPGAADGKVWVGIRPEGFLPCADGPLGCRLGRVEAVSYTHLDVYKRQASFLPLIAEAADGQ